MLSSVQLFEISWTVASPSMRFPRQGYRNGFLCPPPGDLPDPGIEHVSPESSALTGSFFTFEPLGKPVCVYMIYINLVSSILLTFKYFQSQNHHIPDRKFRFESTVVPVEEGAEKDPYLGILYGYLVKIPFIPWVLICAVDTKCYSTAWLISSS